MITARDVYKKINKEPSKFDAWLEEELVSQFSTTDVAKIPIRRVWRMEFTLDGFRKSLTRRGFYVTFNDWDGVFEIRIPPQEE